ncbi:MAG TPA: UDP-N-acetylmuramoyl-L-alanyl-D-glutamate--2,6-diaminopimelate ligase [bacterium]|jgi:UDP-N-acetylmuramoyl-L-alanyl-D-glutamate--2,6-diaminopimelate ligase
MSADVMQLVRQIPVSKNTVVKLLGEPGFSGNSPAIFSGVTDDSRKIQPGFIFVAIAGFETDGHKYLKSAVDKGAGLLVAEKKIVESDPVLTVEIENAPIIKVNDSRKAVADLADTFYGHPSREIRIHGITGTKGKTTTVHLVRDIFAADRKIAAVMGTIGLELGNKHIDIGLTTPGPVEFQEYLRFCVNEGASDIACEVSAHSGALKRTSSVFFSSVTYMNLSRDHLDHFSEDGYLDAKLAISRDACEINPMVMGIANGRDEHHKKFLDPVSENRRFIFAAYEENEIPDTDAIDLYVLIKSRSASGLVLNIQTKIWEREIEFPLAGRFNAQNAAAAASIAATAGIGPDTIARGLSEARQVPGRLEKIDHGQDFLIVVDYAHAPQPAEEVLKALREITSGKLIGVMGAGGNRDRGKRPLIGKVMKSNCDIAVITSDNPRKENPDAIIEEILDGVRNSEGTDKVIVEVDRTTAIREALDNAKPGDTVAILGKGHETYQIFATETIHFDDREVAREWLEDNGYFAE